MTDVGHAGFEEFKTVFCIGVRELAEATGYAGADLVAQDNFKASRLPFLFDIGLAIDNLCK